MVNYLPSFPNFPNIVRNGRRVYEGYQRGWGLEFGDLQEKITLDPDYEEALKYASGRSVLRVDRMMNLFMLIKFYLPTLASGHIVEFGTCRGGSAFFMAALAAKFLPGVQIYALDTFAGMPETDRSIDLHSLGDFAEANFEEVMKAKEMFGLTNVHFIKGLFSDTAPEILEKAGDIALAHIDCDIYEAVRYSYQISKPYMIPMGYIVFDDSTTSSCIGATEAVEDFVIRQDGLLSEQIFPHHVFRARG